MRFLMLGSGSRVPSTRFRVLPYIPKLRLAGHQCTLALSFPPKYEYYRAIGWRLSQKLQRSIRQWQAWQAERVGFDSVFLEREIFDNDSYDLETRFRKATKRFVLDVDDGIFLKFPEKYARVASMADHVICGNRFIEEYTRPFQTNLTVIPTCIDESRYSMRPMHEQRSLPIIGWIGTGPNVLLLKACASALRRLAKERQFRLHVIAAPDAPLNEVDLAGVDFRLIHWDESREIALLQQFDIGIMPLPENEPWMKYKCAAKLLQYMAVGVPAVASPIGVNAELLADQMIGLSATDDDEWFESLRRLLDDASLRQSMGEAGRRVAVERFSIDSNWRILERVLAG